LEGEVLRKISSVSLHDEFAKITKAKKFSFQRWTLRTRLAALVLALAVPLNLLVVGAILQLARSADEAQRRGLLYTARAIAGSVDVLISKNISLGQALANSPALLRDNLPAFRAEALRAFSPATSDAWLLVADLEGRQIFNTAQRPDQILPARNPRAVALQRRALETRSVIVTERIVFGPLTQSWVATIEIPVFKDGQPFRVLAVAMKMPSLQNLLVAHRMPPGWLAGLIDEDGRLLARIPRPDLHVGQHASQGWRHTKDQEGVFDFTSIEGTPIVQANARPSLAPRWTVGIAIPQSELQSAVWSAVRWSAILGVLMSCFSLVLAFFLARRIERPLAQLTGNANRLLEGTAPGFRAGSPELQGLVDALQSASAFRRGEQDASQRLAAIVHSSFDAIISKTLDGTVTSWNASAQSMFGYTAEEMIGQSIRRLIPSDRQHEENAILRRLAANQRVEPFETVRLRKDGRALNVSLTISPITDGSGLVIGASKIARDVSERKARDAHIQLLLREINHRSKNLLSVVQSIAHRTASGGDEGFLSRFSQRLGALAVNQDLLTANEWDGVDLEKLMEAQLAPFAEARLRISGPSVKISSAAAQAIGMAVHELATNATKYGAWSNDQGTGRLDVGSRCRAVQHALERVQRAARQTPRKKGFRFYSHVDIG
jgi:PAS domain S-box-containing protein